jgi:hypothetical protein
MSATSTTPAGGSVVLGGSNTDGAEVTGDSAGGSPTGSVSFYECGPTPTAKVCASKAKPVGSPVALTAGANDTATATSVAFTPTATGYWCFAGYYSGDRNYLTSADTTVDECFEVTAASTSTVATPTSRTGALGGPNNDVVVVTGNAAGGSPTGTVSFYECGPTTAPTACPPGGLAGGSYGGAERHGGGHLSHLHPDGNRVLVFRRVLLR